MSDDLRSRVVAIDMCESLRSTIVDDPRTTEFEAFYHLLRINLRPEEIGLFEVLQQELDRNRAVTCKSRFLCVLLYETGSIDDLISGTYASVQNGILAQRFTVTKRKWRGTGVSQLITKLLWEAALAESNAQGHVLRSCFAECVDRSERFVNDTFEPPMCRIYAPVGDELLEIHYELPHLGEWSAVSGEPIRPESPASIHLQLCDSNSRDTPRIITTQRVEEILRDVWGAWYLRTLDLFDSEVAWRRHVSIVFDETLERRILRPLRQHEHLRLITMQERVDLQNSGHIFV